MSNDTTSWPSFPLGDVCRTTSGGTPSRKRADYFQGDIPWVKSGELTDGLVSQVSEFITEEAVANSSAKLFPLGTLLIAMYGATVGKLGVLAKPAATNQAVCAIFPPTELDSKFLFWFLRFKRNYLIDQAVGGAQPNISQSILRELMVPVPPIDVQRETVAEIEKQFSRLDEAVANIQRVKANLKRYKAAILKAAVEGRLVETEASIARREGRNYETGEQLLQRILEERRVKWKGRGKYKEAVCLKSDNLPISPEGWGWATVEMICESIVDCPHSTARFQSNGYPCVDTTWMTAEGLNIERARYVDEQTYIDRTTRLIPKPGDIVFAREGTIGTAALIPDRMMPCLGQRVMLLRTSSHYINSFLVNVLHSEIVKSQYHAQMLGSTVPHINVGDVKRFAIPVPPLPEQSRIVAEVDRHLSIVRKVEAQIDSNLKRAQALRQGTLFKAFGAD